MRHLIYVIAFTGRFAEMRRFYERGLELPVRREEQDWVEFDTVGASLALHRMDDPERQGTLLRFATDDLDASLRDLRRRGVEPFGEVVEFRASRIASFQDADGNLIQLVQPGGPVPSGAGPPLETVLLHVGDTGAATAFYRDGFGLPVLGQSPWSTDLDSGLTRMSLHPRGASTRELRHPAQPIVVGFEVASLEELGRELAERGLVFTGGPADRRDGRCAEVTDPDGNVVLFRLGGPAPADADELAEDWDDEAPSRDAMRKPGTKKAKATSRLVVKPAYRSKRRSAAKKRGAPKPPPPGPNAKRAKTKPATGRLKKSERKSAARKKAAVAASSRSKPVKRAAARRARPRGR